MAVHVWSKDGDYLGQIAKSGHERLAISAENEGLKKALDAILAHPPMSDTGGIEVRSGSMPTKFLEFPTRTGWMSLRFYTCRLPGSGFTSSPAPNAKPASSFPV